jgi:hypothetical protein
MADTTDRVTVTYTMDIRDYVSAMDTAAHRAETTGNTIRTAGETSRTAFQRATDGVNIFKTAMEAMGIIFVINKVIELGKAMMGAADRTAEYSRTMTGLSGVTEAFGGDGKAAQKAAQELSNMTKGMMNATQAAEGLKFLIGSGYSVEQASTLSKAMLNIGAFNRTTSNLGQAFAEASKGIKSGSVELTENIGLTERLSSVMKRAGIDQSAGIDVTNNAAQRQALYNSIVAQGVTFQGNLDKATAGYTATLAGTATKLDAFIRMMGEKFQPIISSVAIVVGNIVETFTKMGTNSVKTSADLFPLVERMTELESKSRLTKKEQEELQGIMNQISLITPDINVSYDSQGRAIISLSTATSGLIALKKHELEIDNQKLSQDLKNNAQRKIALDAALKQGEELAKRNNLGVAKSDVPAMTAGLEKAGFAGKSIYDLSFEQLKKSFAGNKDLLSKVAKAEAEYNGKLRDSITERAGIAADDANITRIIAGNKATIAKTDAEIMKEYETSLKKPKKPPGNVPVDTKFLDEQKKEIENATADYKKLQAKSQDDKNKYDLDLAKESDILKKQEITDKFTYESDILAEETRLMLKLKNSLSKATSEKDIQNLKDASAKELQAFTDAETAKYAGKIEILNKTEEEAKKAKKLAEEAEKRRVEDLKLSVNDPNASWNASFKASEDNQKKEIEAKQKYINDLQALSDKKVYDENASFNASWDASEANIAKAKANSAEQLAINAQNNAMQRTQDSAQLAYNQMTAQLSQDIIDGKVQSLGDYAAIIGKQLQITLTNIAVESGIQALWETAQGIASQAATFGIPNPVSAAHFTAAATYAATAAAAGLGAVAAGGVAHTGTSTAGNTAPTPTPAIETPTGTDTTKTQTAATKALTETEVIYISPSDWIKTDLSHIESVNRGLMRGKKLALTGR